ncbi:MAG: AMP-binding protein [Haliea sp.]|uniref:class I adenylate-forming enzyme family protein n=1 Tax=Haliea sp. TaxID=1932666 RepID=UPI0032F00A74
MRPEGIFATSLGDLLLRSADQWPDTIAAIFPDTAFTYRQLYDGAFDKARLLQGNGVNPGDHIGLLMPNCPEYLEWLFAIALTGAVAVTINARYRASELAYVIDNADLRMLVTRLASDHPTDYAQILEDIFPELRPGAPAADSLAAAPLLRQILTTGDRPPPDHGLYLDTTRLGTIARRVTPEQAQRVQASISLAAPCLMMYTSGTTSHPKGCPLSHEMVTRKAFSIASRLGLSDADRQWNPLPFFHLASIMPMLATFSTGGSYMTAPHFAPEQALRQIMAERATVLYPAFPTIMSDLVTHPLFSELDKHQIRLINNVAPPERLRENMKLLPHTLHISAYGLTEATGLSCYSDLGDDNQTRSQTIGPPLDGTLLQVVDPASGTPLPAGERGEMLIAGYSVFSGYYKDPEATAAAFTRDGWFRTGDICALDELGRVSYHGRLKETLKVGGENVSALEIESFLSTHPAVKLVQVVGIPDPRLQEVVAAFIELNPGAQCDSDDIISFCVGKVASFKVPRHVEFVAEWPMSATKVQKFRLREDLVQRLGLV